jgi:hypothetical protein
MTLDRPAIQTPSAFRALGGFLCVSLAIHLAAGFLLPNSADRPPLAVPLHVRLAIHPTPQTPPPPPDAAAATRNPTAAPRPLARRHSAPVVAADAPMPQPVAAAPAPPQVDVQAALAAARSIGRTWAAPREPGLPPRPPVTVEAVIARATRPDTQVEERDAAGNWVQRFGRKRCVVAPAHVPHFMRGMVIPAQCEVSKS